MTTLSQPSQLSQESGSSQMSALYASALPDLKVMFTLGEGSYGKVKYAVHSATQKPYAVKIVNKEAVPNLQTIYKEVFLLKLVNHSNIIKLIHVCETDSHVFMIFEHVEGGELFEQINPDIGMDERIARPYFLQLISGVEHMHALGIAHRDLKPENLLLTQNGTLKIIDFGFATLFKSKDGFTRHLNTDCGTPAYVAPEVLTRRYEGPAADVWSCGVILFAMITGSIPWEFPLPKSPEYTQYLNGEIQYEPWSLMGPVVKDLLLRMLHPDPKQRITIARIKQHPWFMLGDPTEPADHMETSSSQPVESPSMTSSYAAHSECGFSSFSQPEPERVSHIVDLTDDSDENMAHRTEHSMVPTFVPVSQRMTRFTTKHSAGWVASRIRQVFQENNVRFVEKGNKFSFNSPNHRHGGLSGAVQIFQDAHKGVFVVDFQRHRGDTYEFKRFYSRVFALLHDLRL